MNSFLEKDELIFLENLGQTALKTLLRYRELLLKFKENFNEIILNYY
jgi:hypothetical protein